MTERLTDKRAFYSILFLVILYGAGLIGLLFGYSWQQIIFNRLTPVTLLVSIALLLFNHRDRTKHFYLFCIIIFFAGWDLELAGIESGIIFGPYLYGDTLGPKFYDVPVIIGINWLILVYCAGTIAGKIKSNLFVKSAAGAGLMVLLDYFIEPNAVRYDYWGWIGGEIPVQNYIAWFLASFLFLIVFYKMNFKKENKVALPLFALQLVFFIILRYFGSRISLPCG